MLATEYLLHRQKELIDKQSELIQDLKKELENKQEIISSKICNSRWMCNYILGSNSTQRYGWLQ